MPFRITDRVALRATWQPTRPAFMDGTVDWRDDHSDRCSPTMLSHPFLPSRQGWSPASSPFLSPPTAIATAGLRPAVANQAKAKHVRLLCVLPDLSFALARRSTRHTYHGTQTHWQGATTVAVCLAVCVALSPASHSGGSGCGGLGRPTDRPRALARRNQGQTHLCRLRPSPDLLVRPIVCISMPLTRTREPRPTRSASCPTASRPRHGCPPCCQKRMAVSRETWSELPHATRSGWQLAGGPAAARFVHPAVDQKRKRIERSASASRSCPLRSQRGERGGGGRSRHVRPRVPEPLSPSFLLPRSFGAEGQRYLLQSRPPESQGSWCSGGFKGGNIQKHPTPASRAWAGAATRGRIVVARYGRVA